MGFKITAKPFAQLLNTVSALDDEARINVSDSRVDIKLVDGANVAMGVFRLIPDEAEAQEPIVVDVNQILGILKHLPDDEVCTFKTEDKKTSLEAGSRWFDITHNEEIRKEPKIIRLEPHVSLKIKPSDLNIDLKLCSEISEYVDLCYSPRLIELKCDGKFRSAYPTEEHLESEKESRFSLDYMCDIISHLKYKKEWICEDITLSFGQDWPVIICGCTDQIEFCFLLAPRIEGV